MGSSQSLSHEQFESEAGSSSSSWMLLQQDNELDQQHQPATTILLKQEEEQIVDIDLAILQERHNDILQLHSSMKQINEIQKSLAFMVEAQSELVDQVESDAMQSLEHASEGVAQVLALQKQQQQNSTNFGRFFWPSSTMSTSATRKEQVEPTTAAIVAVEDEDRGPKSLSSLPKTTTKKKKGGVQKNPVSSSTRKVDMYCRASYQNPLGAGGYLNPSHF
jgi:hypothetical protein